MTTTPRSQFDSETKIFTNDVKISYWNSISKSWIETGSNTNTETHTVSSRGMNDVIVENFHILRQQGNVFFNPCTRTETKLEIIPAYGYATNFGETQGSTKYEGTWYDVWNKGSGALLAPPDFSNEKSRSATAAYANVNSAEMLSLVSLFEIKETKEMLLHSLENVARLRSKLHRWYQTLKSARTRTTLKTIYGSGDAWLAVRYGWTPLYHEIKALCKVVDGIERKIGRQTFRGNVPIHYTDSRSRLVSRSIARYPWKDSVTVKGYASSGVMSEPRVHGKPDTLGVTKIPETIYELTRLSFVLDWFFNVGDTIAAWTPDTYWAPMGSWTTVKYHMTQVSSVSFYYDNWINHISPFVLSKQTEFYDRSSGAERGVLPTLAFRMNWKHYIDSVALSRTKMKNVLRSCWRAINSFNRRRLNHVTA